MPERKAPVTRQLRRPIDCDATMPIARPRRLSKEFLAVGVPMTPQLQRVLDMSTVRTPGVQVSGILTTGKLEERYARRIRRSQAWVRVFGPALIVIAMLFGIGVGWLIMGTVAAHIFSAKGGAQP